MAKPMLVPTNAPPIVAKRGMNVGEAERNKLVSDCLARLPSKAADTKVTEERPKQQPLLGLARSTGITHAPPFKARGFASLPATVAVAAGRVDDDTFHVIYADRAAREDRIVNGVLTGVLPTSQYTTPERTGDIVLGIVYDTTRDDSPGSFKRVPFTTGRGDCPAKTVAATERLNEKRAEDPFFCAYDEHTYVTTDADGIMNVVRELLATSRVKSVSISNESKGGFVRDEATGAWDYRVTKGDKMLTRASFVSALKTPKGDEYKRVVRQVTQRLNYDRDPVRQVHSSRSTFSHG